MNLGQAPREADIEGQRPAQIDTKLEVVVLPVTDADRAKRFYGNLGWRLDADFVGERFRVVQYTPRGSLCSIIFGEEVTSATPGWAQGLHVIVSDIVVVRDELIKRGVEPSELFHDAGGVFHHAGKQGRLGGAHPERRSYASFASFSDPDGNGWLLQQVTARLPGRADTDVTSFASSTELASALRRAAASHSEHKKRTGNCDADWPAWYAECIVREQAGLPLPA